MFCFGPSILSLFIRPLGAGHDNNDGNITLALVFDDDEEESPDKYLILNRLRLEVDERIELHTFVKDDFKEGDPRFDLISTTGISLT